MNPRTGIIAGGNWIVDHVKVIDAWPPQDALATILSQSSGNGGSAYNLLKNLAKLGAPFPLEGIGLVGNDADGAAILADCRTHRIDLTQLQTTKAEATSYTDVMTERATGRRTFFHQRGANALLAPADFDFRATRARIFHLGYILLLDALDAPDESGRARAAQVLEAARAAGMLTSLDGVSENGERFATVVKPVLPAVDLFFANDFEAEKLTRLALGRAGGLNLGAVARAARELIHFGVREWAIVHFPEGACACSAAGELVWQGGVRLPADMIKGTAGAGDAFAAGTLFGLHENWPMPRCLELGVCAAAASLQHLTCSESMRPAADCLELGRRFGFRPLP
jgi:sugar/nucleoside kinase (ribokinase family)